MSSSEAKGGESGSSGSSGSGGGESSGGSTGSKGKTSSTITMKPGEVSEAGGDFKTKADDIGTLGTDTQGLTDTLSGCEGAAYNALVTRIGQVATAADGIKTALTTYSTALTNAVTTFTNADGELSYQFSSSDGKNSFYEEDGNTIVRGAHRGKEKSTTYDENGNVTEEKNSETRTYRDNDGMYSTSEERTDTHNPGTGETNVSTSRTTRTSGLDGSVSTRSESNNTTYPGHGSTSSRRSSGKHK